MFFICNNVHTQKVEMIDGVQVLIHAIDAQQKYHWIFLEITQGIKMYGAVAT